MEPLCNTQTLSKIIADSCELKSTLENLFPTPEVVLVKGVYDLFHIGHYYSFVNAKTYGNMLIVAVSSDTAVKKRKGENRPIVSEHERMMLIASLACVDWVTLYDDESPYEILKTLRPNVFAASNFNFLTELQKAEIEAYTRFQVVPKTIGYSTSMIIDKILKMST